MTESQIKKWVQTKKRELRAAAKEGGCTVTFKEWEIRIRHPSQGHSTLVLGYFLSNLDGNMIHDEHSVAL